MIDRAGDNYELDIENARRVLAWQPQFSLRNTLPVMLEGLKVDPERWYKINKLNRRPPFPYVETVQQQEPRSPAA